MGERRMTPEVLQAILKERDMWSQPHLNTQLFLNYKGFEAIESLELFVSVRTLHLGNNNIARIEGLERMSDLRSLHLEGNRITRIEGLEGNRELRQLNLEANALRAITGLAHLQKLEQLNVSKNSIEQLSDLEELRMLPALSNIDLSNNQVDATAGVVEFWQDFAASLKVLRFHGNPGVRHVEHYRKRIINALPNISYLDERPVFPVERMSCAAWATGGMEAMHKAKRDFVAQQHRMQCAVDPERRELLTRNRKAAIARIEREAREREEEEAQRRATSGRPLAGESAEVPLGSAVSGDPTALAEYTRSWQRKVDLHGVDGVRAAVVKEETSSQNLGNGVQARAESAAVGCTARAAPQSRPLHLFAPPARGPSVPAPAESGADGPRPDRPARDGGRVSGVSDFRAQQPEQTGEGAAIQDRQFSVLDHADLYEGCGIRAGPGRSPAEGPFGRGAARAQEEPVVPAIWEALAPSSRAAELEALEQSAALAAARQVGGPPATEGSLRSSVPAAAAPRAAVAVGASDELNFLD